MLAAKPDSVGDVGRVDGRGNCSEPLDDPCEYFTCGDEINNAVVKRGEGILKIGGVGW